MANESRQAAGRRLSDVGRPADAERQRLTATGRGTAEWKQWGPYLAERQWGTVREDYSASGDAWSSFPHDHARSRAYRWGEDGLLGISDDKGFLCFAPALWNGRDPILKERLFGLTNPEGNHGEDVKECYYYLDATPTASYLKALYKYPQEAYPYERLIDENRRRGRDEPEFEILDTGIFDGDRYFDVFVEYAKADPEDVLIRITVANRGPEDAAIHLLPTLWFRNTWSWKGGYEDGPRQALYAAVLAIHRRRRAQRPRPLSVGRRRRRKARSSPSWLFTENETNYTRLYGGENREPLRQGCLPRVRGPWPARCGESGSDRHQGRCPTTFCVSPRADSVEVRLRLSAETVAPADPLGASFDEVFAQRIQEADAFYAGTGPSRGRVDACARPAQGSSGPSSSTTTW